MFLFWLFSCFRLFFGNVRFMFFILFVFFNSSFFLIFYLFIFFLFFTLFRIFFCFRWSVVSLFICLLFNILRSEEHTSELQSRGHLVCRLLLEKKKQKYIYNNFL